MILTIDTTSSPAVAGIVDRKTYDLIGESKIDKGELSEELLLAIDKLLINHKLLKSDIELVIVNPGPGSYTGLRIGVTVANFLSYSLNVPIIALPNFQQKTIRQAITQKDLKSKIGIPILPVYKFPPNITKRKKG